MFELIKLKLLAKEKRFGDIFGFFVCIFVLQLLEIIRIKK